MKLVICRWVPASGKSTWAKKQVKKNWALRFNKDDLRKLLNKTKGYPEDYWSHSFEREIVKIERESVEEALKNSHHLVIVDNTHLGEYNEHIAFYENLADIYNYSFEIKQFDISLEEAIERDKKRENSVWKKVIEKHFKYAYPKNPTFRENKQTKKNDVIVVDIDWTLAFMDDKRSPYDYSMVKWDRCNNHLNEMLNLLKEKYDVFIVSWRSDDCINETKEWLKNNGIYYTDIFMRKTGDNRKDAIVKKEIAEKYILPERNVFAVFDDRQQVVDMWRLELNIPTYQVWYGSF